MTPPAELAPEPPPEPPVFRPTPGRASQYSPEIGDHICARIAAGESGAGICREPDMPSKPTLHRWLRRHPEFARQHAAARAKATADQLWVDRARAEGRRWRHVRATGAEPALSRYDPELGHAVGEALAQGLPVRAIGSMAGMPSASTIHVWLREHPDFADLYVEARRRQADAKFDLAWEIAQAATPATVHVARLQCEVLRWQVAALAPKKYGLRRQDEAEPARPLTVVVRRFAWPEGNEEPRALEGPEG